MSFLKKCFNFYINSNIHVSVAVFAFLTVLGKIFNINVFYKGLLLGNLTFCAYHITRFFNRKRYQGGHQLHHWFVSNKIVLSFLFALSFLCCCSLLPFLEKKELFQLTPFALLTFFYGFTFYTTNNKSYSLRFVPGIKIFVISFVWSGVITFWGCGHLETPKDLYLLFILVFLWVIVLTIPFDIRDYHYDSKSLKTLPQLLGVKNVKKLGYGLLAACLWIGTSIIPTPSFVIFTAVSTTLGYLLYICTPKSSKYLTSFYIEGIPIAWLIVEIICNG